MSYELIGRVTIPNYVRNFHASEAMRAEYYEKGRKSLPVKYCNKELYKEQGILEPDGVNFFWRSYPVIRDKKKKLVDFLVDAETDERVIANTNKVGKPSVENINGQSIYNGTISRHKRNKMMGIIKDQLQLCIIHSKWGKMLEFVEFSTQVQKDGELIKVWETKATKPINRYPIIIQVELWDKRIDHEFCKGKRWDVGNRILPYNKAFEDTLTELGIIEDDCMDFVTGPPAPLFYPIKEGQQRKLVYNIFVDRREYILNFEEYQQVLGDKLK